MFVRGIFLLDKINDKVINLYITINVALYNVLIK